MNFSELSKYLRVKHNLPSTWEVYAFESLPRGWGWAHVEITGGSPTGKKGNYSIWDGCLDRIIGFNAQQRQQRSLLTFHSTWEGCLDRASFLLSFEEIAQAKAAL